MRPRSADPAACHLGIAGLIVFTAAAGAQTPPPEPLAEVQESRLAAAIEPVDEVIVRRQRLMTLL